jgi:hypothetical protein
VTDLQFFLVRRLPANWRKARYPRPTGRCWFTDGFRRRKPESFALELGGEVSEVSPCPPARHLCVNLNSSRDHCEQPPGLGDALQ